MITVSVPSKVHLLGEHSVVYGRPALLAAINKRISVSITSSKTKQIQGVHLYMRQIKRLLEADVKYYLAASNPAKELWRTGNLI